MGRLNIHRFLVLFFIFIVFISFSNSVSGFFIDKSFSYEEKKDDIDFFKLGNSNDQWYFIDPNNQSFFSTGISGVSANAGYAPDLGYSVYHQSIIDKYGDNETWANATFDRLRAWGFNTIASGDKYIKAKGLPYCINLGLAFDDWQTGKIPDFFSSEWIDKVEDKCRSVCINYRNDSDLLGYFLDNEIHWGSDWRSLLDLFDTYMLFPADNPGKNRLVDFLKQRYNDINDFNLAWRTSLDSFDEILNKKYLGLWPYTVDARLDHNDFAFVVAEHFFKTCHKYIRLYDSNHLILGCRFQSFLTPRRVVQACGPYVDVVSVNHYLSRPLVFPFALVFQDIMGFVRPTGFLEEFYDLSDKPVLISEFYFRARDSGLPNTKPSKLFMPVVFNQRQRALCFEVMARGFVNKPYSVGYHWFSYVDQPYSGRFDGENSNIGVVNKKDEPYAVLVDRMAVVNRYAHNSIIN